MNESRKDAYAALLLHIKAEIPGFRIAFKDDPPAEIPRHHRVAHAFAARIIPHYRTRFTTVLAPVVYLPSSQREAYLRAPEAWLETMRHEYIHLKDAKRHPFWMPFSYVLIFPMGVSMRAYWELRGYAQNMIVRREEGLPIEGAFFEQLVQIFRGRSYLFMLRPEGAARRVLGHARKRIEAGEVCGVDAELSLWGDFIVPLLRKSSDTVKAKGW